MMIVQKSFGLTDERELLLGSPSILAIRPDFQEAHFRSYTH